MAAKLIIILILMNVNVIYSKSGKRPCRRPNEHFECGSVCQKTCASLGVECPIPNVNCHEGCYCDSGFARNAKGKCIPIPLCMYNVYYIT